MKGVNIVLKQMKGFMTGILAGVFLVTSISSVWGDPVGRTITAYYNNIKIYVDGKLINPLDGSGKPVEPFVYDGTTYLPVRAIGEALGQNITWDGETQSVYIGQKPLTEVPKVWINDITSSSSDVYELRAWTASKKDNTGKTYAHGGLQITSKGRSSGAESITYKLNSDYVSFSGTLVLANDYKDTDCSTVVRIYGDDKLLYTSPEIIKGSQPTDFKVNVERVMNLKIEIKTENLQRSNYSGVTQIGIVEAGLK
ncbi:MAG: NPCBM/NEW2 domain-containing protein [Syntrophomonadaceae bacterium]|nr:NPCBM/NEW2 domain-containing protein [Syntrophomonadaceae bacterium]